MTAREAELVRIITDVSRHRDEVRRQGDGNVLAVLAGEGATIWGKRVEFMVTWPDGLPLGFTTDEELRAHAAELLAANRAPR